MKCYLCGAAGKLTGDHIPPKGFFPKPRPSNLIKVPCCEPCNQSFSKDDEAVRLWLCCHIGGSPAAQWIFDNKIATNTLRRAPGLLKAMRDGMKDVQLQTEHGVIEAAKYPVPWDRVERFMIRLTKGLLTHYHPAYDYTHAAFDVRFIGTEAEIPLELNRVRDLLGYDYRGDGVFKVRGGLTRSGKSGVWLLVFYDSTLFIVAHSVNNWGKPAE